MVIVSTESFPDYDKPPLTEVVCGILFQDLESFLTPHVGLLWEKFKLDYPYCEEVAPLAPAIEKFSESLDNIELTFSDIPPLPRVWFINENGNGIIQIQRDRFLHNWKKINSEDVYPKYSTVIKKFRQHILEFEFFLKEIELEPFLPLQYELTYVNHIFQGDGWKNVEDVGKIFPNFSWHFNSNKLLEVEGINWRTVLALPDKSGRLYVTIRNGIRQEDEQPVFIFELTARGIGRYNSRDAMWEWFDLAHKFLVQSFAELTSKEVQKNAWRYKK